MEINGIEITDAKDGMIHLSAYKPQYPALFVRACPSRLEEVTDFLFDKGYKVGQCAEWYWWQQCDKDNPDKEKGSIAYEVDTYDNLYNWYESIENHRMMMII